MIFYCKHVPCHYWLFLWNSNSASCVLSVNPTFSLCLPISRATPVTQPSVRGLDHWYQPQKPLQVLTPLPWKIPENSGCLSLSLGPHQHQRIIHRGPETLEPTPEAIRALLVHFLCVYWLVWWTPLHWVNTKTFMLTRVFLVCDLHFAHMPPITMSHESAAPWWRAWTTGISYRKYWPSLGIAFAAFSVYCRLAFTVPTS